MPQTQDEDIERLKDMDHADWQYCSECGIFLMPSEIDKGDKCGLCIRAERYETDARVGDKS